MPAACGLVFLFVLLLPVAGMWVGVSSLLRRFAICRTETFRLVWVGLPMLGVPFVLACVGAYVNRASAVYYRSFGEWPTADVQFIEKENWAFGDVGGAKLIFRASPETFERLQRQIPPPPAEFLDFPDGRHGWGNEDETLAYDPGSGIVTYVWRGVD